MKKAIIISISLFLFISPAVLPAAQVIGVSDTDRAERLSRDLDIMESVLLRELKENDFSFFSVQTLYYGDMGVIFTLAPKGGFLSINGNDILNKLDIEIPRIPELPKLPETFIFQNDDGHVRIYVDGEENDSLSAARMDSLKGELTRVRVELERSKKDLEKSREELSRRSREKEKAEKSFQYQVQYGTSSDAKNKDREIIVHSSYSDSFSPERKLALEALLNRFYVNYLSGLRNLESRDKVLVYVQYPEENNKSNMLAYGCSAAELRDFRREKLSEETFLEKVHSYRSDLSPELLQDLNGFSSILWEWAVEDPNWMFMRERGSFYLPGSGYVYTFSTYMVGKALKSYKVMAKGLWMGEDNEETKADLNALRKEEEEKREGMLRSLLETAGIYARSLKALPDKESLIIIFEMSDSRYGLDDGILTVQVPKKTLMEFYREKIDLDQLVKKADVSYTKEN